MWLGNGIDFSPLKNQDGTYQEDEQGNLIYPYNNETYKVRINVYAEGEEATGQELTTASSTGIESISIGNNEATEGTSSDNYDYSMSVASGTTSVEIDVDSKNINATVTVEPITESEATTIKQMSTKHTLPVEEGNNYFKITVTSANKAVIDEYVLKVFVGDTSVDASEVSYYNSNTKTCSSDRTVKCALDELNNIFN